MMIEENNKYVTSLIELTKRGSHTAFLQLVKMNMASIYTLAFRLQADMKAAEETVKSVFLFAWDHRQQVRMNSSFNAWLVGITVAQVLDEYRNRTPEEHEQKKKKGVRFDDPVQYFNKEKKEMAILSLDETVRIIFVLHDILKYEIADIASLLGGKRTDDIAALLKIARKNLMEVFYK